MTRRVCFVVDNIYTTNRFANPNPYISNPNKKKNLHDECETDSNVIEIDWDGINGQKKYAHVFDSSGTQRTTMETMRVREMTWYVSCVCEVEKGKKVLITNGAVY